MTKEELEELQKNLHPTYWNAKQVDKIWHDILNQDAMMIDRLTLERFKSVLDAMIVKTIQIGTKEAKKRLNELEDMKRFYDRIAKMIVINKAQADIITTFTIESYRLEQRINELETKLDKKEKYIESLLD